MNHQDDSIRQQGLYRREYEHDACGVGMVANLSGEASHEIVVSGMTVLKRLMHRGATGNDPKTGDGAGLLLQIPHAFFRKVLLSAEIQRCREVREDESLGVAMLFGGEGSEDAIENIVRNNSCEVIAWRDVPVNPDAIGRDARKVMPKIRQMFIAAPSRLCAKNKPDQFEQFLYKIRCEIEKGAAALFFL